MSQTPRLAAILAADVAGYSRPMGANEEGTLEHLEAIRRRIQTSVRAASVLKSVAAAQAR
jgi:class 3 adenylate cyclase